jgi:hypothetical protein
MSSEGTRGPPAPGRVRETVSGEVDADVSKPRRSAPAGDDQLGFI